LEIWDKKIHQHEFRLRLLLTNSCNKNCSFCLNDFQKKPSKSEPVKFLNTFYAFEIIQSYCLFMKKMNLTPIITFSGGEPGFHPHLKLLCTVAKGYDSIVKVVTNGTALDNGCYVDFWHIGVTEKIDLSGFRDLNIKVQIVVTENITENELLSIVQFYVSQGIQIKLFRDFFSEDKSLDDLIIKMYEKFPKFISSRFTGLQENRGRVCNGCTKKCITLKAMWVFPDGTAYTCPQGNLPLLNEDTWYDSIKTAYYGHLVET